jgi:hypothetical protein
MFTQRPKEFNRSGLERLDISMVEVKEVMEGHYFVQTGTYDPAEIHGGYEFDVFGNTGGTYYLGSEEVRVPGYRMHIKFNSSPERHRFAAGIIGGGKLHEDYVEVELSLDPDFVRDILYELRRDQRRELRVAGYAHPNKVFWADMFMLSTTQP